MSTTLTRPTAPTCDECGTELHVIGTGDPKYWSCRYCGGADPITERSV